MCSGFPSRFLNGPSPEAIPSFLRDCRICDDFCCLTTVFYGHDHELEACRIIVTQVLLNRKLYIKVLLATFKTFYDRRIATLPKYVAPVTKTIIGVIPYFDFVHFFHLFGKQSNRLYISDGARYGYIPHTHLI